MTNKEWLCSLPAEKFYETYNDVIKYKGRWDINTSLFMIEWLDKEHTREDEVERYKEEANNYYAYVNNETNGGIKHESKEAR